MIALRGLVSGYSKDNPNGGVNILCYSPVIATFLICTTICHQASVPKSHKRERVEEN